MHLVSQFFYVFVLYGLLTKDIGHFVRDMIESRHFDFELRLRPYLC